ncbi:hypothetical protein B0A48_13584 [Cryoendolithus antarcticus]|uniref:Uncharacterized protein n=1 Tax=Cryoendolithus antarcticus TaxID=1507870 RepID=A0A1V8SP00_9PEZI|nr:hypothetical protein B0A48_13584 [Cryoendolithus antarcticus]
MSITAPEELNEARRQSIKAALGSYRNTVLDHNLSNLRAIVNSIESQPCGWRASMSHLREQVMRHEITNIATSPRSLLDPAVRLKLIETCDLDGIYHLPDDFPLDRGAWYARVRALIESLVDGIGGSGLPRYQFIHQCSMLDLAERSSPYRDDTVTVGEDELPGQWDIELDIALCIKIGRNEEHSWGGSYVLWCRKAPDEQYAWKYAAHADEWASDVYDTLEE